MSEKPERHALVVGITNASDHAAHIERIADERRPHATWQPLDEIWHLAS